MARKDRYKTYLIALKLAQFAFLNKRGQTTPILLLDEIFEKLDACRVEQIIKLVSENGFGQIFITDTNRKYLDEILLAMNDYYALFRVECGEVQPYGGIKMQRRNTQTLGEVLRDFFEDNTELHEKMMEIRVQRGWGECIKEPTIMQYTR